MSFTQLQKALGRKFVFTVVNAHASANAILYILTGYLNTLGNTVTQSATTPFGVSAVTPHWHTITPVTNAGFSSGVVNDDGSVGSSITCTAQTTALKIRQFRNMIEKFPQRLQELTIAVDNQAQFDELINFAQLDPALPKPREWSLNVSDYFDRYQSQSTKVTIKFDEPLVLDASTVMYSTIRYGRTVTYTFKFA